MSMVRALRTLTALENGTMSGAQLETQLSGSTARRGEFALLCARDGAAKRMAASAVTMTAVTASATAMAEFVKHTAARMAAWGSDNALIAIKASATAMSACRAAGGYAVKSATSPASTVTPFDVATEGRAYIVLGVSTAYTSSANCTFPTKRGTSSLPSTLSTDATADSSGADSYQATPVNGPVSATFGVVSQNVYIGLLRCDA
jgi:hypothetical protein